MKYEVSSQTLSVDRSICRIVERSLKWFSDAINEQNLEVKIVKLAIAIESLVNFSSDSKEGDGFKKKFIERVCIINKFDNDPQRKAEELYNARCAVAHGSSLKNSCNFDIIHFTASTLLFSIKLFSQFNKNGLDETRFNKALPKFIDSYTS